MSEEKCNYRPKATWQIGDYHKQVIIDFFRQVMTQEQRRKFMQEHPAAYNDMYDTPGADPLVRVQLPGE